VAFPTSCTLTIDDLEALENAACARARQSYWAFLQLVFPKIKRGAWPREVALELQAFYEAYERGERPILVIQAPPQHGKSTLVTYFLAWCLGRNPDTRQIYASYSERLGIRANLTLQRVMTSRLFKKVFPECRIPEKNAVTISGQKLRNREIIQTEGKYEGYFRNTTVAGAITGESLDLGVIDDAHKNREEANSPVVREKIWAWFNDDFRTRFSEFGGLLIIMTRWHVDDMVGRMIAAQEGFEMRLLRYPAIAENGEALFAEHKSVDFIMARKKTMSPASFAALYQQQPVVVGGELFKDEYFRYYSEFPKVAWRAIYADTAQKTGNHNDYTVFQCWGRTEEGKAIMMDMIRGKWETPEMIQRARMFYEKHAAYKKAGEFRGMRIEDASSGSGAIQVLRKEGFAVNPIEKRKIDKWNRGDDVVPFFEAGLVLLPRGRPWLSDYMAEMTAFPAGAHDDMADATIDAVKDIFKVEQNLSIGRMLIGGRVI